MSRYSDLWALHQRHTTDLLHILETIGQRGIRVDKQALEVFNTDLDARLAVISERLDSSELITPIRRFHPPTGYKKTPTRKVPCSRCCETGYFGEHTLKNGKIKKTKCGECVKGKRTMTNTEGLELHTFAGVERWARRKPFLPTSWQQVLDYIQARGHKTPYAKQGDNESTAQKGLLLMWRKYKDDNYKDFVDYRKIKKLRGVYGEWPSVLREYRAPGSLIIETHSYVTTKFTLKPDTGRLSSINPNIQQIPTDGPLAEAFRACLIASPGHKLISGDLDSVEAFITGYFAGDMEYMRLARLGIHKYYTAKYLNLPVSLEMSDGELRAIIDPLKKLHPALYKKMKAGVYGANYLSGPATLFKTNPEEFESVAEAAAFQRFLKRPKISAWQASTMARARKEKKLVNPFSYSKQFWDVRADKSGGEGPAAVAFLPQSTVAAIMRECMLQLWGMEAGRWMVWQVHDSLILNVPDEKVELCVKQLEEVLTQPWPELGGLRIGVKIEVSENLV